MKKLVLGVVGVLVVLVLGAAVFVEIKFPQKRPAPDVRVQATPAMVARGKYLVENVAICTSCHSKTDPTRWANPIIAGTQGAGGNCWTEAMDFPGKLCAKNLTPDPTTGLGKWTDGEILRAFREGVDRDGHALFNLMPYTDYRVMSDDDAKAVVAYLRTLPAVKKQTPKRELNMPLPIIVKFMPKPLTGPVAGPNQNDSVARGKYLARIASCKFCHTPVDAHQTPLPGLAFAGGHVFKTEGGATVVSANLTPDASGITGTHTKQQFIAMFKAYANPAAQNIKVSPNKNTEMPWLAFSGMTDADLGAIYDYLKTVKPIHRVIKTFPHPTVVSAVGVPSAPAAKP